MDFNTYQRQAERTMNLGDGDEKKKYANFAMGLSGEAGEVTDYLKKVCFHDHNLDKDKLKDELGDVMWYVAALASVSNIPLEEIAQRNIEKLQQRYPEGFSTEMSRNRKGE
ncbi:nucleoside triphosphate pyrophosphohydrolase family protein [Longirhabdus pacifica]|uniref:nucleoside triphosphate pyrophosphohydrolase family protein n=1 Tax=Longirhabdus pacifica TaxID=2305227 RepID=UPI001008BFE8|nr:nucleoside triphosphate pyrophosphohydrolase family protein [Longirhabdus pacifica]